MPRLSGWSFVVLVLLICALITVNFLAVGIPAVVFIILGTLAGITLAANIGHKLVQNANTVNELIPLHTLSTQIGRSIKIYINTSSNECSLTQEQVLNKIGLNTVSAFELTFPTVAKSDFLSEVITAIVNNPHILEVRINMTSDLFTALFSAAGAAKDALTWLPKQSIAYTGTAVEFVINSSTWHGNKVAPEFPFVSADTSTALSSPNVPTDEEASNASTFVQSLENADKNKNAPPPVVDPLILAKANAYLKEAEKRQEAFDKRKYYLVLDVSKDSSEQEKKEAVKKQKVKWHSDRMAGLGFDAVGLEDLKLKEVFDAQFKMNQISLDIWDNNDAEEDDDSDLEIEEELIALRKQTDAGIAEFLEWNKAIRVLFDAHDKKVAELQVLKAETDASRAEANTAIARDAAASVKLNQTVARLTVKTDELIATRLEVHALWDALDRQRVEELESIDKL